MTKYIGKCGISARIIQASICKEMPLSKPIYTFELEYPRFIHAELMTHRMFSRNAASSRAIPVATMHKNILENPATPVHWGKNQAGMSAKEELVGEELDRAKKSWVRAVNHVVGLSHDLMEAGLHKQLANRFSEAAQMMKTIVTATEWDNWFELRWHEDAQPEIYELARCMIEAMKLSLPENINRGEWHVPYVNRKIVDGNVVEYYTDQGTLEVSEALAISASCCAQVSYRKNDDTLEKALNIFDKLINSKPMHASPVEHQATPHSGAAWARGITHTDRKGYSWSGNFRDWIQHRQLL